MDCSKSFPDLVDPRLDLCPNCSKSFLDPCLDLCLDCLEPHPDACLDFCLDLCPQYLCWDCCLDPRPDPEITVIQPKYSKLLKQEEIADPMGLVDCSAKLEPACIRLVLCEKNM